MSILIIIEGSILIEKLCALKQNSERMLIQVQVRDLKLNKNGCLFCLTLNIFYELWLPD